MQSGLSRRFKEVLVNYFENRKINELGSPNIDWVAKPLAVSPRYLRDSLKVGVSPATFRENHM